MPKVFPGYSLFAEPLRHAPLGQSQLVKRILGRVGAHAEWFIELLWNVEPDDFNGNFATLEFALIYLGCVRVLCRLQGVFTVVLEFHRIGDQPVIATKFAQLVELRWYFPVRYRAFLELLQNGC